MGDFVSDLVSPTAVLSGPGTFDDLPGSWDLHWERGDGEVRLRGTLTAAVILGGRAVQDVWTVPADGEPGFETCPEAFHGTTVRFFDSELGVWRSTWVDPVKGRVLTFVGEDVGDRIELTTTNVEPRLRWVFSDRTRDGFTWTGWIEGPDGWAVEDVMRAVRVG